MKIIFYQSMFIFAILSSIGLRAQVTDLQWAHSLGGSSANDGIFNVTTDLYRNVYSTGVFNDTVDFDPGSGTHQLIAGGGSPDIFIQKHNALGEFEWAVSFGNAFNNTPKDIITDTLGNVYVIGQFQGTVDVDPGPGTNQITSNGSGDVFLIKLDPMGNLVWVRMFGSSGHDEGESISLDKWQNIYLCGFFRDTVDFGPGSGVSNLVSAAGIDAFMVKFSPSGQLKWAKSFGGPQNDFAKSVANGTLQGDLYVCGYFHGTCDFDPGVGTQILTSLGSADIFVSKLDTAGNLVWVKSMGGKSHDYGFDLGLDSSEDIYFGGSFYDTTDLDPGTGISQHISNGFSDMYIAKLSSAGSFQWAQSMGGVYFDQIYDMAVSANGNSFFTGSFDDTVDVDPGSGIQKIVSHGSIDILIEKLDPNGQFGWAKQYGSTGIDLGLSIDIDASGALYLGGSYSDTLDVDAGTSVFNLTSNGDLDAYLFKMGCPISISSDTVRACNSYTWINGITYLKDNDMAVYALSNSSACDSIVRLYLTITPIDIGTFTTGDTITANDTNASYQWLDCDNGYMPINGAIGREYISPTGGSFAVEITNSECIDTSACVTVVSIQELANRKMKVYPNPNNGSFVVDLGDEPGGQITLTDMAGRLVLRKEVMTGGVHQLTMSGPAGNYLMEVVTARLVEKFVLIKTQ